MHKTFLFIFYFLIKMPKFAKYFTTSMKHKRIKIGEVIKVKKCTVAMAEKRDALNIDPFR